MLQPWRKADVISADCQKSTKWGDMSKVSPYPYSGYSESFCIINV
ncbi:hypothetical protein MYAER_0049 [Microcystis aeruginosa NIES-2549]|uniref:Uncharacterized protein n=1 Tax=Microcystis aeruginosa NIES-2549 TaxID=1641812 RepID=A0A0F6RJ91_MICAE|nr:hypothetical protein MYAER_0049 [Microcystis aeruginosa NIES-2549]AOC50803.1 hypothetical protein amyaer_0048 [Microcystis aeruginosa NIES-2481]